MSPEAAPSPAARTTLRARIGAYFRGEEFQGGLRSAALFTAFGILGTFAFLLARYSDWLDERDYLRYEFGTNTYALARDAQAQFAEGIPRNLTYIEDIAALRIDLNAHLLQHDPGGPADAPCLLRRGGPSCAELHERMRATKLEWAKEVRSYTALCEQVSVVFDHVTPDWIREQAARSGRATPGLAGPDDPPLLSLADEVAYVRAQIDVMNDISPEVIAENTAEFNRLAQQRGVAGAGDLPADSHAAAAILLGHAYGEASLAFTRCLRQLEYGLKYHRTLRDYGLDEGRKGT
jgi:hypothetical protein